MATTVNRARAEIEFEQAKRVGLRFLCRPKSPNAPYPVGSREFVAIIYIKNSKSKYANEDGEVNTGWFVMSPKNIKYLRFILSEYLNNEHFQNFTFIEKYYNFNDLFL